MNLQIFKYEKNLQCKKDHIIFYFYPLKVHW